MRPDLKTTMDPTVNNAMTNTLHGGARQRGAALIVGLILLLVLTVLGVSTMRTASLELVMAGNVQFRENAFQLASSGLDSVVEEARAGAFDLVPADGWQLDLGVTPIEALDGAFESSVRFRGEGQPYGSYSIDKYVFHHYQVDSEGRTDQRGARSLQSQGIVRVSPRDPNE